MTAKIKLNAASGGGSVSLKAPSTTTSNAAIELQLPVADGSADTFLKTDGSGTLSFGAVSSDYVKLQQATGTSGGSEVNFDNLDVATYKFFDVMAFFQPATDAQALRLYYRTGGASGSNLTGNSYAYGFNEKKESNTSNCTAGSPDTNMRLTGSVGNHASEGVFITMRISMRESGDNSVAKWLLSSASWNANYREQGNAARMVNGQGHLYDDGNFPTGFGFHFASGNISNYFYTLYGIKG